MINVPPDTELWRQREQTIKNWEILKAAVKAGV